MTEWLNRTLGHQGPVGEGVRKREAEVVRHPLNDPFESCWSGAVESHISRKTSEIPGFPVPGAKQVRVCGFH